LVQNTIVITSKPWKNGGHIIDKQYYKQPKKLVGICSELQATKETADSFVFNSGMYLGAGLSNPRHKATGETRQKRGLQNVSSLMMLFTQFMWLY
jgi:hypothetical protein